MFKTTTENPNMYDLYNQGKRIGRKSFKKGLRVGAKFQFYNNMLQIISYSHSNKTVNVKIIADDLWKKNKD